MPYQTGKKCMSVILLLAMMLSAVFMNALADPPPAFAGGDGSLENPYEVSTQEQLYSVRNYLNSHFIQVNNIAINTALYPDWSPIGIAASPFTGSYDGGNFEITGLRINTTASSSSHTVLGLFGVVGQSAMLSNIRLENVDIDVASGTGQSVLSYIGGLAGVNWGTILNCNVTGRIDAASQQIAAGGLVGNNGGTNQLIYDPAIITGCTSGVTLDITVNYQVAHVGGLAGEAFTAGSLITNSSSTGAVTCRGGSSVNQTSPNTGGLIGYAGDTEIESCSSDSAVTAADARSQAIAGGLIGGVAGNCTISNCLSSGNVTAFDASGSTNARVCAGGLIGYSFSSSVITNCSSSGNAIATGTGAYPAFSAVYSGGFLGFVSTGTNAVSISQCYASGNATATVNTYGYAFAGGFGGSFKKANVSKSYSKGNAQAVAADGFANVGGFIGYMGTNASSLSTLANCFSTGNAAVNCASSEFAGGLSGVVENAAVSYCYSAGIPSVSHDAYLTRCGGLAGSINSGTISNSFYDSTVSGKSDTDRGTPMSTSDMTRPGFVTTLANAGADWKLVSNLNGGYPLIDGVGLGALPTSVVTYKNSVNTSTVYGTDIVAQGYVFSQPSWVNPENAGRMFTGWYTDLSCENSYKWNFSAQTASGAAHTLYAGWETPPDTTVPVVSDRAITVNAVSQTGVTLSWNRAADDISTQASLEYLVYFSGRNNLDSVANIEANGTAAGSYATDIATKDVTGLLPGTTYYFNVIVKDEAGNKTSYTTKQAATNPRPGTASYDTNLVINGNAESDDKVMVGWTAAGTGFKVWTPADIIPNPGSLNGGNVFHYHSGAAAAENMQQTIDISSLASDIARGMVNVRVSTEARKHMHDSSVTVQLDLLDDSGSILFTCAKDGISADGNYDWSTLTFTLRAINANTRKLRITLAASISNANPLEDFIEFDGVSLILTGTPTLTAGLVNRTGDTDATVAFSTDKAGTYYYKVVEDAQGEPAIDTVTPGTACTAGENIIRLAALTAGAKDIYIKVKDAAGNVSTALMIDIPAHVPSDAMAPTLTAGTVDRTSDTSATVVFTSDEAGMYYYDFVDAGTGEPFINTGTPGMACGAGETAISLTTLTAGAKDIYIKVKDAAGNVSVALRITIPAYLLPDTTAPALTAGAVNRLSDTSATVSFVSDEAGTYYFGFVDDGGNEPYIDLGAPGAVCTAGETVISLTALTAGAKDIYIRVKDAAGNVSAALKLDIPIFFIPVTCILGVPSAAVAGMDLPLTGTAVPAEATNQTIVWSLRSAGATGANIVGSTLSTTGAGVVTVTATIIGGASLITDYTQDFNITVYTMAYDILEQQVDSTTVTVEGLLAREARLIVVPIAGGNVDRMELEDRLSEQNAIAAYEIHVEPADAFRPPLTLSFQIGQTFNGRIVYILHKLSNGSIDIYTPTVTNGEAVITVNELSPFLLAVDPAVIITRQPQSALALVKQTVTFHVEAEGMDSLTYRWQRRTGMNAVWEDIPGAIGADYTTTRVNMSHNGYQYRVIVSDILGNSATSDTAVLTVTVSPDTGDDSQPVMYAILTVLFAIAVIMLLRKRRMA